MSSELHSHDRQLYTISDLLSWTPPSITRIISDGVLNIRNKMLIFGDEGSWKSMLALHTAHCLARGTTWLGFRTTPSNTLKLQVELPLYMDRDRTNKYCNGSKSIFLSKYTHSSPTMEQLDRVDELATQYAYPPTVVSRTEQFLHIDESSGFESLKRSIESCISYLPAAPLVVILDPLYKMFNRNLSDEQDVKPMLEKFDILMEDLGNRSGIGISTIIIHHTRKAVTDDKGTPLSLGSQDATGSRALVRWADTVLRIDPARSDETMTRVNLTFTKHRNAEAPLPIITLRWNRDTLHPRILSRRRPIDESEDNELEIRSDLDLSTLE